MRYITVDGVEYKVNLKYATLNRNFSLYEGDYGGPVLTGRTKRDIIGTKISYELAIEQDTDHPEDYDLLYEALSDPTESHVVTFPYGQSTLTYQAMITEGSDTYGGKYAGVELWNGLVIQFEAIEPQKSKASRPDTRYLNANTYTPGTTDIVIRENSYLVGPQTILGDENLVPANIVYGVEIFGVTGETVPAGDIGIMTSEEIHEAVQIGWYGLEEENA